MPNAPNPLLSTLRRVAPNKQALGGIAALVGRFGAKGLVMLARGYLGPLADRAEARAVGERPATVIVEATGAQPAASVESKPAGLTSRELAVLGMATSKLVFEIGELALFNPDLDPAGKQPNFVLDEHDRGPAISLAHVLAAARFWRAYSEASETRKLEQAEAKRVAKAQPVEVMPMVMTPRARLSAARSAYYGTAPRVGYAAAPSRMTTRRYSSTTRADAATAYAAHDHTLEPAISSRGAHMSTSHSRGGCASCGGSHALPAPQPLPTYDRCGGGLDPAPRPPETCSGCGGRGGCGCGGGAAKPKTRTYDKEQCPTLAISCETKQALRDCVKTALCDFLRCMSETLCPDGRFDSDIFDQQKNPQLGKNLIDCVGTLACSFMHCIPDALCPPECEPAKPVDYLPCGYAVEDVR